MAQKEVRTRDLDIFLKFNVFHWKLWRVKKCFSIFVVVIFPMTRATCFHSNSCWSFLSVSSHLSSFLSIVLETFSKTRTILGSTLSTWDRRVGWSIIFPSEPYQRDRSVDHMCGSRWWSLRYCNHIHDLPHHRLINVYLRHSDGVVASTSSDYHWIVAKYRTVVFPQYPRIKMIDGCLCLPVVAAIQILRRAVC